MNSKFYVKIFIRAQADKIDMINNFLTHKTVELSQKTAEIIKILNLIQWADLKVDVTTNPRNPSEKVLIFASTTDVKAILVCNGESFNYLSGDAHFVKVEITHPTWGPKSMTFTKQVSELGSIIKEEWDEEENFLLGSKSIQESIEVIRELEEIYTHISAKLYDKISKEGMRTLRETLRTEVDLDAALSAILTGLKKAIESEQRCFSGHASR